MLAEQAEPNPRPDLRPRPSPRRLDPQPDHVQARPRKYSSLLVQTVGHDDDTNPGNQRRLVRLRRCVRRHGRLRHPGSAADPGIRHGQRRHLGPVPAVRRLLLPTAATDLRPGAVLHLPQHLLRLSLLQPAGTVGVHVRRFRGHLRLRCPVRRRVLHPRILRHRHPRVDPGGHDTEFPIRLRPVPGRHVRAGRGPHGAGPRAVVRGLAGRLEVRRGLLLLPPADVELRRPPGVRQRLAAFRCTVHAHAEPQQRRRRRPAVLLPRAGLDLRRREEARDIGSRVLERGDHNRLRDDGDVPASGRLLGPPAPVQEAHVAVPKRGGGGPAGHLLRLREGVVRDAAGGGAGVPGSVDGPGRQRHRVSGQLHEGLPGVRRQRQRLRRRHPRQRAAEDVRRGL
ncbi:aspartyl protease family protein-like [Iris pallida]|uniref:Aspartyl protease family protein-like n=1 Tax=Iris pallida TaxID=29817 RepID=A0AAX6GKY2_IRIPA|nr:aspartyl protease family protein-like [Iris pallida]